jgi:hypothetical protein
VLRRPGTQPALPLSVPSQEDIARGRRPRIGRITAIPGFPRIAPHAAARKRHAERRGTKFQSEARKAVSGRGNRLRRCYCLTHCECLVTRAAGECPEWQRGRTVNPTSSPFASTNILKKPRNPAPMTSRGWAAFQNASSSETMAIADEHSERERERAHAVEAMRSVVL